LSIAGGAVEQRAPELISVHRQFLQQGCDKGWFLLSGASVLPARRILIARAESLAELNEVLPRFVKITELDSMQHHAFLANSQRLAGLSGFAHYNFLARDSGA
jgi:hypothetical protein